MAGRASPPNWRSAAAASQSQARVPDHARGQSPFCLRRRKFVVVTTNSNHTRPIYPNLASGMALTGNQLRLWVADITASGWSGVRLPSGGDPGCLSRRVITMGARPDTGRQVDHWSKALTGWYSTPAHRRRCLVHHSDRGVQYASRDLHRSAERDRRITISMSREGKPLRQRILRIHS